MTHAAARNSKSRWLRSPATTLSGDQIDHFERKVQNGYYYNTSPPGNITEAYRVAKQSELFKPVELPALPGGRQSGRGRFRFIDREGIDHLAPPSWLVADLLPVGGYGVLVGAWGSFKTFLALDLALTVATGFPAAPTCHALQSGPVLFIAGEGRSGVGPRIRAWERLHASGQKSPNFVLADPVPNIKEDWAPFIAGAKDMFPAYKLVVIDTIGRAMQGANENSQEFASLFTNRVQELQQGLDCAVLAVHHLGKDGERGARGSSVFGADADMMIQAVQLDTSTAEVTMLKQKDAAAWEQPQTRKLVEVDLGSSVKSLVVMQGEPGVPRAGKARELFRVQALHASIDKAILDELATNKGKAWSTAALAQSLACREDIDIDSATLQAKVLRRLREDSGTQAARCYDRQTRRWRHQS